MLKPKTEAAKRFVQKYGCYFGVISVHPVIIQAYVTGERLVIENEPDGVYVNGEKFCEHNWEECDGTGDPERSDRLHAFVR